MYFQKEFYFHLLLWSLVKRRIKALKSKKFTVCKEKNFHIPITWMQFLLFLLGRVLHKRVLKLQIPFSSDILTCDLIC